MSTKYLSALWDLEIESTEKMVLMCLCDHANDEDECWPSVATISRKCSKSERTVQMALKWLSDNKFFTFTDIKGRGRRYKINPRRICTPAKSAPVQKSTSTPAESAPHPRRICTQTLNEPLVTKQSKERARSKTTIPDGWTPSRFASGSKSQSIIDGWPPGQAEEQFERFTSHHRSKGSEFSDWQAAWGTWVLNSKKFGNQNGNGNFRTGGGNGSGGNRARIQASYEAEQYLLGELP